MNTILDNRVLEMLTSVQKQEDAKLAYYYSEGRWISFDATGRQVSKFAATQEVSDLSGNIDYCGVNTEVSIYRLPMDDHWSIDYVDTVGRKFHYGKNFSSDEDAFESFVTAFFNKQIDSLRIPMGSSNRGRFCKPFLQSFTSPERQQFQRHNSILGLVIYVDAP